MDFEEIKKAANEKFDALKIEAQFLLDLGWEIDECSVYVYTIGSAKRGDAGEKLNCCISLCKGDSNCTLDLNSNATLGEKS